MLCAAKCNESLDWLVIANLSLHIHVRAAFSVSSRNEYFYMPKYNSLRSSRHFLEQFWKLIRFYFSNPDTHCLPATLLLFTRHAPFFEFHLCLSRTVKNTPEMKFLSRSLFHREHTSILILLRAFDFPFFLLVSRFIFICSVFIAETSRSRRCLT